VTACRNDSIHCHWQTSIHERFEMLEIEHRLSRATPIGWEISSALGVFTTEDRSTWRTDSDN
jgi:hypothetical protein